MKKSKVFWIVSGIIILFNLIVYLSGWGGDTFILYASNFFPVVCALLSIIFVFITFDRFKKFDYAKIAWLMILLGIIFYFLGELTYALLELFFNIDMNETFPSVADYFWCIGYIPLFAGLLLMFIGYKRGGFPMGKSKVYLMLFVALIMLLVIIFFFVFLPIFNDLDINSFTKFFYLFYPVADLLIVVPAVVIMYITSLFGKGAVSKPWKYLVLGFIFFTFADLTYSYLNWRDLYGASNIIDIAWNAGYLLIGLAGIYQRELVDSLNLRAV